MADNLAKLKEWTSAVRNLNRDFMDRVAENYRFTVGLQWNPDDVEALDEAGKPHLTYNEILPKLNVLVGEYFENVFEPSILPRRKGTATAGYILQKLLKHCMDLCNGNFEEAAMFLDGISTGIGNIAIDIDDTNDPFNGDAIIRRVSPFNVEWDWSSSDYNPDVSCRFVTEKWWWDINQMVLQYPKKERDLKDAALDRNDDFDHISDLMADRNTGGDYEDVTGAATDLDGVRRQRKEYLVRQTWWKEQERRPHLLDKDEQKRVVVAANKLAMAKQMVAMNPQRYAIKDLVTTTLIKTVYCGDLVLEEVRDPFGANCTRFPIRRFFPYYFDGYWLSPVDSMKDPQREMNKRISQTLHVINSIVRFFFLNKQTGGAKRGEIESFLRQETQVVNYDTEKPELVVPNLFSAITSLSNLSSSNMDIMSRVSSINDIAQGRSEYAGQSGKAIDSLASQFKTSSRHVFSNMSRTRQAVYECLVDLICNTEIYSEWEIKQLVDRDDVVTRQVMNEIQGKLPKPPQPPKQPNPQAIQLVDAMKPGSGALVTMTFEKALAAYQEQKSNYDNAVEVVANKYVYEQIRSLSLGRYGVRISQKPMSQSISLAIFGMMLEMRKMGMVIPDDIMFKASELPEGIKDELIERYQQMMQLQAAAAQPAAGGA